MNHEDRQALIQFNHAIITQYEASATPEAHWPDDVKKLASSLRLALASLKAEPFGRIYIDDSGDWAVSASMPAIRPCDDFHVYTVSPAPEDWKQRALEAEKLCARWKEEAIKAHEENEELQSPCNALAAENAVMLKLLTDISENHVEYFSEGEGYTFAGVPLDYVSEINMYVSRDVNAENPFPATDGYLNSVRAEGVEKLANEHQAIVAALNGDSLFSGSESKHAAIVAAALYFAAQLRAGKQND